MCLSVSWYTNFTETSQYIFHTSYSGQCLGAAGPRQEEESGAAWDGMRSHESLI